MKKIALAIHGGAGTILRSAMTPELEREYRGGLEDALRVGWEILERGGSSLDAVEAAVVSLEDFPLFNAGRGSVFTHEGKNEMDAAIMDGTNLKAGAVAFVRNIKNPIKLARLVMERTEHVLVAGDGANQFAAQMNVETADDAYFFTDHRWQQLQDAIASGRVQLDHSEISTAETQRRGDLSEPAASMGGKDLSVPPAVAGGEDLLVPPAVAGGLTQLIENDYPNKTVEQTDNRKSQITNRKSLGTVGAVACDSSGRLAAATSTGGMTNKRFGRVGDTALIGAGTYANANVAVSCTGHGEFFILAATAHDLAARMKYKGLSLAEAAQETIAHLTTLGGEGGLIAIDTNGNVVLPFNSEGMYRGFVDPNGNFQVDIYKH